MEMMKIYEECCYPPVSTLDLTWENSGSLYWLKVEGEYFLFGRGLLAEAVWSEWCPPFSPGRQRFSAKQNVLSVRGQGGAGGHTAPLFTCLRVRRETVLGLLSLLELLGYFH